jgi:haloalkane dehalogenase
MRGAYRTPDERFARLPGFDFTVRFVRWSGLRLAYVEAGRGPAVVLFHGEPTWSYLYRRMIPVLVDAGYRVVAPDLPGFGRSDKPTDPSFYTYDRHTAAMTALLRAAGVEDATAVVHDWGGPIGLRIVVEEPGIFSRISVLNTGLFTGSGRVSEGFARWRSFVERTPDIEVGRVMRKSAVQRWPEEVIAGYDAPFPTIQSKAGMQRFPLLVPLAAGDEGAAEMASVRDALSRWNGPAQVLFSTDDPIFPLGVGRSWVTLLPTAERLETVEGAGHFLQEDRGEMVASALAAFLDATG